MDGQRVNHSSSGQSVGAFAEALGSNAPAPGGGAASALVGALAAALAEMVARFTVGRAKYREVEPQAQAIVQQSQEAREALVALVEDDSAAFQTVSAAYALPRGVETERQAREAAIHDALQQAMQPPLRTLRRSLAVMKLAREIAEIGNTTVLSDAACAATIGEAAIRAAALNVLANVALLPAGEVASEALAEARAACDGALHLRDETLAMVYQRMGVEGL
ncbi:MAG: cyclodeaminase/cyclohydrolase family protein [Ktedonobacterales bacterium]